MRKFSKIICTTFIVAINVIIAAISIYCLPRAFYVLVTKDVRLHQIERALNNIPNVQVTEIYDDINPFKHEFICMNVLKKTHFDFKENRGNLDKCIDPLLYLNGCKNKDEYLNKLEWKY